MNLDLSGEQVALRDTVRRALAAEAPAAQAWERLAGLGALDVLVPEVNVAAVAGGRVGAARARDLARLLHELLEALIVDGQALLGQQLLGHLVREAVGVVQPEGFLG